MREPKDRLKEVRKNRGYGSAAEAARALGVKEEAYRHHENGTRGIDADTARRYAKAFGTRAEYILYGDKPKPEPTGTPRTVPLVGYVAAGAQATFTGAELGEVDAPDGSTPSTVAVEVRGDSLGALFDKWLVFYDDVRRPVTSDLIGRLCVVGLEDERVLVKQIKKSRSRGLFHLLSNTEPPILDVAIEWAARVRSMVPR